jgi:hypothetical protein
MDVRVWVGCLGCYNEGRLSGKWVDASEAADWKCPEPVTIYNLHEETWCMDQEIPGVSGELAPMTAVKWAEVFAEVEDYEADAFCAWMRMDTRDPDDDLVSTFRDAYMGEHESIDDFAWYMLEETEGKTEAPSGFMLTVDTVAWEQDYTHVDGHIFSNYY